MSRPTTKLIEIIEKKAGDPHSWTKAQKYLQQGADLKAPTKNGSMIDSVIAEERRLRPVTPWNADNCVRLIHLLIECASNQLAAQVFSADETDLNEMRQLVKLKANCYQMETYGPLGLLGSLLKQDKVPIRLNVVKFLIDNDRDKKYSWATVDDREQTYVSIAKKNQNRPQDVIDYIQQRFDMILNQSAFATPPIHPDEIIKWVNRGARIDVVDDNGNTALSNAVKANNIDLVRVLITLGSNTMHKNRDGCTPLEIAQNAGSKDPILTAILSKQGINVQLKNLIEEKRSRLTIEDVNKLLDQGANINATFANNDSILHILITNHGKHNMITAFVDVLNADLSAMNMNGLRPIETCIKLDKHPFDHSLAFLKSSKMSTDLFFNQKLNKNILQFATEQNCLEVAKVIQDELNLRLWNSMTAMNTNETNNTTIMNQIKQLIDYGAQINYKHQDNVYQDWTILHLACKTTTKLVVQYIIENCKANYMLPNQNGDYPISIAAEYGQLAIVEYLHDLPNSTLNICNKDRETPLHLATKNHHLVVAKYLVRWGADPQAQNASNQTPLNIANANATKNKEEEISDRKLIEFFQQLICPPVDGEMTSRKTPNYDLDTCELAAPVEINTIETSVDDVAEGRLGDGRSHIFARNHNENLHSAAKHGDVLTARQAIAKGADIRHRREGRTPYEVTQVSLQDCMNRWNNPVLNVEKRSQLQQQITGCQEIASIIQRLAQEKLSEAINNSNASLVKGYHLAGAPLTAALLEPACNASDKAEVVEIVDYLIYKNTEIYHAMINNSSSISLYRNAKKRNFTRLSAYLKYQLSIECGKAIKENNLGLVKKLVRDGASVDTYNSRNIDIALQNQNVEMIRFLCENGAILPTEWLTSQTIILPSAIAQQFKPEIRFHIDRCLINRRLRFAAANGDMNCLIQCQRLGADINSINCHGSTALLCTIQHGNYFPIVHTLASCGASMLHSNEDEPLSLIDLAKKQNYKQIANYLLKQLNAQFLTAVLNNERQNAEALSKLGANFNYQDEQKRTPLYYAVEYHGIELVEWLCERDSSPTPAEPDINGDYPIILATEKGDYPIVEYFVTKYAATRSQVNRAGLTALQIAEKLNFKRIAQVIITGKPVSDSEFKDDEQSTYTDEIFKKAAKDGPVKIIEEFIKHRYESMQDKTKLCYELIVIAKAAKQWQIVDILEPYYKKIRTQLPPGMGKGEYVVLSKHYKEVLFGFLAGLSNIIANSDVVLDPTDPNTYEHLFSDLSSNIVKRSQELQQVTSEHDVKKLIEQDLMETKQQLARINEKLEQTFQEKDSLQAHIDDIDQRVSNDQQLTAKQRKQYLKDKEDLKNKFTGIECSMAIYERQQQATLLRQKTMNFIKSNSNLFLFYNTIQHRLEALFTSAQVKNAYIRSYKILSDLTRTRYFVRSCQKIKQYRTR